jgi:hypothetical protein
MHGLPNRSPHPRGTRCIVSRSKDYASPHVPSSAAGEAPPLNPLPGRRPDNMIRWKHPRPTGPRPSLPGSGLYASRPARRYTTGRHAIRSRNRGNTPRNPPSGQGAGTTWFPGDHPGCAALRPTAPPAIGPDASCSAGRHSSARHQEPDSRHLPPEPTVRPPARIRWIMQDQPRCTPPHSGAVLWFNSYLSVNQAAARSAPAQMLARAREPAAEGWLRPSI